MDGLVDRVDHGGDVVELTLDPEVRGVAAGAAAAAVRPPSFTGVDDTPGVILG
jgi:hypothetical protein